MSDTTAYTTRRRCCHDIPVAYIPLDEELIHHDPLQAVTPEPFSGTYIAVEPDIFCFRFDQSLEGFGA